MALQGPYQQKQNINAIKIDSCEDWAGLGSSNYNAIMSDQIRIWRDTKSTIRCSCKDVKVPTGEAVEQY